MFDPQVMYSTRVVIDMIDRLNHRNAHVRRASGKATELVLEMDRRQDTGELGELGMQIRKKRYEGYNRKWMAMLDADVGSGNGGGAGGGGGGGGGGDNMRNIGYFDDDDGAANDRSMDWGTLMESRERLTLEMNELERGGGETGPSSAMRDSFYDHEDSNNSNNNEDGGKEDEDWYNQFQ